MARPHPIPTNFAIALFCAVVCGTLTLQWGCGKGDTQPITSKSSKFEVAGADDLGASTSRSESPADARTNPIDDDPGAAKLPKPPSRPPGQRGGQDIDPRNTNDRDPPNRSSQAPPVAAAPKLNPDKIPDGTPEELFELLDKVEKDGPRGRTNREQLQGIQRWLATRLAICEKVLASEEASDAQLVRAATGKREVLLQMIQAGVPDVDKRMLTFCEELKESKSAPLVRLGRLTDLQLNLAMLMSNATQSTEGVESAMEAALALDPADNDLFRSVMGAAVSLQQAGLNDLALDSYQAILKRFAESDDEAVTKLLPQVGEMAKLLELKFDDAIRAAAADEPDASPALLAAVVKLLEGKPSPVALERVAQTAYEMEITRHGELAAKIYETLGAAFKDHPDEEVAKLAAREVESGQRRAGLIGQPLQIEGKRLDGKDFDWKTYEGKVVLVDFWATWCAPCRAELPNIKRNYERYRDKGFEVVGINLDEERGQVDQFFSVQSLPWTTVVDAKELADKCGVESIPFVVLVGRDGKVIDLHIRGELLGKRLAELFEQDGDGPDAKPAAKTSRREGRSDGTSSFVGVDEPAAEPSRKPAESTARQAKGAPAADPQPANEAPRAAEKEPNPYLAKPNLKTEQLVDFLLNMQEKPKSIQNRPGFSDAIVDAADRVLAADASDKFRGIAAGAKLDTLHKRASVGDQQADEQLQQFVETLKDKPPAAVGESIRFLLLERQVIGSANSPVETIPEVLAAVKKFCSSEKLESRHLRLASSTVEAINRLEDGDAREKLFAEFGNLFAKSSDKELSRYGKKLAKAPAGKESDLVGKPLELVGTTSAGAPFDWNSYRGKVVVVDFWATWCGPCIRELPNVRATHEKYKDKGFDIVGVSIDHDQEALAEFLEKNPLPWTTLAGEGTQDLAQKYGVRAIPTVMLIGRDGKVVAVSHRIDQLIPELEKLLKG